MSAVSHISAAKAEDSSGRIPPPIRAIEMYFGIRNNLTNTIKRGVR